MSKARSPRPVFSTTIGTRYPAGRCICVISRTGSFSTADHRVPSALRFCALDQAREHSLPPKPGGEVAQRARALLELSHLAFQLLVLGRLLLEESGRLLVGWLQLLAPGIFRQNQVDLQPRLGVRPLVEIGR